MTEQLRIDNKNNLIIIIDGNLENPAQWGIYNTRSKEYIPKVTLPKGHQILCIKAYDDCIVWIEDETDFTRTKLQMHIYDRKSTKDKIFYTPLRNPSTEKVYDYSFNEPIVYKDKIYFEEYDSKTVNILCYDIKNNSTTTVQKDAKCPMIYAEALAYLKKGNKDNQSVLYSEKSEKQNAVLSLDTKKTSACICDSDSIILWNWINTEKYEEDVLKSNSIDASKKNSTIECKYSIEYVKENKTIPVVASINSWVDWPRSNNKYIVWNDSNAQFLFFYNKAFDKVIKISVDSDTKEYINVNICEQSILFYGLSSKNYYIINLEKIDELLNKIES